MMILTNNKKTFWPGLLVFLWLTTAVFGEHTKNIMLTGYWPPTNEMMRKFSTNLSQNPGGWQGSNWEGRGYNIYAFFPEFPPGSGSKGEGDFEVDYQDVSNDFWLITNQIHPVAILSFGQGAGPWEIEYNARNLSSWASDYLSPTQPTVRPPDSSVPANTVRHSTLPCQAISDAIDASGIGVNAWVDWNGDPGAFLCEYMAYHDAWYQSIHSSPSDQYYCAAAGFTHLSSGVTVPKATQALEIALRVTIAHLDGQLEPEYALTILTDGNGTVDINPQQTLYDPNTQVTLTAQPVEGATFIEWTGDATGSQNPLTITMNSSKTITAHFQSEATQYQLTVSTTGNGTVQQVPGGSLFDTNTEITLTAVAADGNVFSHWSGDASGSANPLYVIMNSNKTITANFVPGPGGNSMIWGVTGSGLGTSSVSEVFLFNTAAMAITKLTTTSPGTVHADIAVTPSGRIYTIGNFSGSGDFTYLMQLNPATGIIERQWNLATVGMNALTAKDDQTLLGVQYGGAANLIRIQLDAGGAYVSYTNLGQIDSQSNSGGDIAHTPADDFIAATNSGTEIWRVPVSGDNPNPAGAVKVCDTSISAMGALAYDYNSPSHTLYAGSYNSSTIYTLNLSTGQLSPAGVTNPNAINHPIYGMDIGKQSKPIINQQPVSQSLLPGAKAIFDIGAEGTGTISYTWQFYVGEGWNDIQSTISSALEINDINDIDIGNYRCLVSNEYGITNSDIAALRFGDLDGLDPVNFIDFDILAADYGKDISGPGDVNRDNAVDFEDIAILIRSWLCDFDQE